MATRTKRKYFKTAMMVFFSDPTKTANQLRDEDWMTFTNMTCAPIITGNGYEVYRDALIRRGFNRGQTCTADNTNETFTATAHGLLNDQPVMLFLTGSSPAIPAGLASGTRYFILNAAANTFQLASSPGGDPLEFSTNGTGIVVTRGTAGGCFIETPSSAGAYPTIQLIGREACAHWCALFDRVFLGHAPSKSFIKYVKILSTRKPDFFLYFFNLESIAQSPNGNSWFNAFDTQLRTPTSKLLDGSGPGGTTDGRPAGCVKVDYFETSDYAGGTPTAATVCGAQDGSTLGLHTWLVNTADGTLATEFAAGTGWIADVRAALLARYDGGDLKGILIDNCNPVRAVFGATNYSAGNDANYLVGLQFLLTQIDRHIGKPLGLLIACNGAAHGTGARTQAGAATGHLTTDQAPVRYQEFWFCEGNTAGPAPKTFVQLRSDLDFQEKFQYENVVTPKFGSTSADPANFHAGGRYPQELWMAGNRNAPTNVQGTTQFVAAPLARIHPEGPGLYPAAPIVATLNGGANLVTVPSGHGLQNGCKITFLSSGGALPAEIIPGQIYFVIGVGATTFQISNTHGGAALDFTGNGTGTITVNGVDCGTWTSLLQEITKRSLNDKFYVVTCRGSTIFGLFWVPEMGPVT